MDILSIIIIAIGLAMDCFAVSISKGICVKRLEILNVLKMAVLFGFFQALMPLIGFWAGKAFIREMSNYDHWVAFALLSGIGGKMLIEGLKPVEPDCDSGPAPYRFRVLLTLAIATSIDALASGIIFVPFPLMIYTAIAIIGCTSFILTFAGTWIGVHFGKRFHFNVEIAGGFILIAIGLKILLEHLFFS